MLSFTVETLKPDEIRAVYPLIREAVPSIDLQSWLRFARQLTATRRGEQSGIVTARRVGRHFPCGLFCYRVDNDLQRGRVLIAEHFVAVDLLDPAGVLTALVQELEALGKRLGCAAVRSVVHGGESEVSGGLSAAGHAREGSLLVKPLFIDLQPKPRTPRKPRPAAETYQRPAS
jgi:hypothetical protein